MIRFFIPIKTLSITIAVLSLGILAVRSLLRLEAHWDTFMYHVPFAALRGGLEISYEMNDRMRDFFLGYPPLPHFLQGILWRFSGSVNGTGVINYGAFVAFLAFCHKKLSAPFWLVCLIALTAPMVLIHMTVSYVDLFANSLLSIGICSFVYLFFFGQEGDRSLLIMGLIGLVGANWSKYLMVPITSVFFALFFLKYSFSGKHERRRQSILLIVAAIFIAWAPYVKNLIYYRNPFWPVKVPIVSSAFPYTVDTDIGGLEQRPPSLKNSSQIRLFFSSLLEFNHPKSHSDAPRWVLDQGQEESTFRMGGFWNVSVVIFLTCALLMSILLDQRKGMLFALFSVSLLFFVSILPQSHELRYYQFIPLCWAGTIGMLFPPFHRKYNQAALCFLILVLGLFVYMAKVNRAYYKIERLDYKKAADLWAVSPWWDRLKPGVRYCVISVRPIAFLMTGPTMREFEIIDRSREDLCPQGSVPLKE